MKSIGMAIPRLITTAAIAAAALAAAGRWG
jgi:hypothetical protein